MYECSYTVAFPSSEIHITSRSDINNVFVVDGGDGRYVERGDRPHGDAWHLRQTSPDALLFATQRTGQR